MPKYSATVFLTVVHSFELEAEDQDEAEVLAMDIAEARAGQGARSVGSDKVYVEEIGGEDE